MWMASAGVDGQSTLACTARYRHLSAKLLADRPRRRPRLEGPVQQAPLPQLTHLHSAISADEADAISRGATVCWNS